MGLSHFFPILQKKKKNIFFITNILFICFQFIFIIICLNVLKKGIDDENMHFHSNAAHEPRSPYEWWTEHCAMQNEQNNLNYERRTNIEKQEKMNGKKMFVRHQR